MTATLITLHGSAHAYDQLFSQMTGLLFDGIRSDAHEAVNNVLNLSSRYLSETVHEALVDYYGLYFNKENKELDAQKKQVNEQVGDIFESAQSAILTGRIEEFESQKNPSDNDEIKGLRLQLAELNKKLEAIVQMDAGIKKRLMPVLGSMQFEDALTQRLQHLQTMWQAFMPKAQGLMADEILAMAAEFAKLPTSIAETAIFYEHVLQQAPPEGMTENSNIFFDF